MSYVSRTLPKTSLKTQQSFWNNARTNGMNLKIYKITVTFYFLKKESNTAKVRVNPAIL